VSDTPDEKGPSGNPSKQVEQPDPQSSPAASVDDDLAWLQRTHQNREHSGHHSHHSHHGRGSRGRGGHQRGRGRRHHPRWYRPRNTIVFPLLALVLLVAGFLFYVNHELGAIRRAPINADFSGATSAGTNVLLIASNARTGAVQADVATMVVQLVHLGADGSHASLIDLPRDLVLPDAHGRGRASIAVQYLRDGTSSLVSDLQSVLGIDIEHAVQINYAGYVRATDTIGGVDVSTETGVRHLSGSAALSYVDQRGINSVVAGQRNQHWLRGIIEGTLSPGVLLNPVKIIELLHDVKPNLILDDALTTGAIRSLAWHSRGLSPTQTRYLTVPYRGYEHVKGSVVLLPDLQAIAQLGAAVRADNDSGIAVFDN